MARSKEVVKYLTANCLVDINLADEVRSLMTIFHSLFFMSLMTIILCQGGFTPLHYAASNDVDIVSILVDAGANVNILTNVSD